jgi:hypothetical protein
MLMIFDLFAGAAFGSSMAAWTGVESRRRGSLGMVKGLAKRVSVGERAAACPYGIVDWL